jgi:hypothetical protein
MQEITSAYDDMEKRLAVFGGLGALVATSLYLFTQGADLWTYLIRGVLALTIVTILLWVYLHWLRSLVHRHTDEEALPENVHRQSRDAQTVQGHVVAHAEMPDAVIPAESADSRITSFAMPDFEMPAPGPSAGAMDEGDLPPPPVPAGL